MKTQDHVAETLPSLLGVHAFLLRGIPLFRCASESREIFWLRKAEPTAVKGNGAEVIADKNIVSSLS